MSENEEKIEDDIEITTDPLAEEEITTEPLTEEGHDSVVDSVASYNQSETGDNRLKSFSFKVVSKHPFNKGDISKPIEEVQMLARSGTRAYLKYNLKDRTYDIITGDNPATYPPEDGR